MKLKLFLMSVLVASNVFCAEQSKEFSSTNAEGETVHANADGVLILDNPVVKEITFPNGDYFRVVSADGEQQVAAAIFRRISYQSYPLTGPENKQCVLCPLLVNEMLDAYCQSLAMMLSDPNVMKFYLSGVHYPRNTLLENKIALMLVFNARDNLNGHELQAIFAEFFKDKTEADMMNLSEQDFPENLKNIIESDRDTLSILAFCFLSGDNIEHIKNEISSNDSYLVNIFSNYRELIIRLVKDVDYQLPQKVANHLNLDLKRDGLPRFVLNVDDQMIGFMRFGAYPKSMIEADLKENPDALALLAQHYLVDRGCAIAAVMIQAEYQHKGYVEAFGREMFGKILPWYATCQDAPKYPEGQLGQVYITHRIEQLVTAKLVEKLRSLGHLSVIELGSFVSSGQEKMAYLVRFI
ncbi:MAG TPA: hypothetical protein DIC42_06475 [Holosporales bacterium]|nr:hypothetical protein [Holosporales bacterium]